jgi:hypothetical protein
MSNTLVSWVLLVGGSGLIGVLLTLWAKPRVALWLSGLVPWCFFLALNVYWEFQGPEKELLQGTWIPFQVALGTLAAASGLLGNWLTRRTRS